MLNIIKSYLAKEEFYIIVLKNNIYIKNYSKIIGVNDNEVLFDIQGSIYKITGNNFILTKTIGKEVILKGQVERIIKYDNN